jgi:iron complex transport system substrate-binding protein
MRYTVAACLSLLTLFLLSACEKPSQQDKKSISSTQTSQEKSQRIISLGGQVSETLVALGFGDQLVAVDTTSVYPAELSKLPSVGYIRQLSTEGIIAMQPELILASEDAGPPHTLDKIKAMGIDIIQFSTGPDIESALTAIEQIGSQVGVREQARQVANNNRLAIQHLLDKNANRQKPRVLFILSMAGNLPLIAGSDTKANTMITTAGGINVAAELQGYKPGSPEAILKMRPDIIVAATHGLASFGGAEALRQHKSIKNTPAAKNQRVVAVEIGIILSMGPRIAEALTALSQVFYPEPIAAGDS